MNFKYTNIGLSGVAGCGKNTAASIFGKLFQRLNLPYREFSIANNLKKEIRSVSKDLYGIDSFNCSREEKDLIRPFLVAHGEIKRKLSNGRYWVDQVNSELDPEKINIITDVRFNEYAKDEVYWIKNEIKGVLVHISQFEEKDSKRIFLQPANQAEAKNDPLVKREADFILNWRREKDATKQILNCEKLLKWLKNIYAGTNIS
jgi:pantothenate kinase